MKRQLFTFSAGAHQRQLIATTPVDALAWVISQDQVFADAGTITIERRADVVDLTSATEKPQAEPAGPRTEAAPSVPPPTPDERPAGEKSGMTEEYTVEQASTRLGITVFNVKNLLQRNVLERARPGRITEASIVEYQRRIASGELQPVRPRKAVKGSDPRSGAPKPSKAQLSTLEKVAKTVALPNTANPDQDRFVQIEKLAPQLGLTVDQVEEIKRNGNIAGGFGWVNATKLQAYMESPEYEPPFTSQ